MRELDAQQDEMYVGLRAEDIGALVVGTLAGVIYGENADDLEGIAVLGAKMYAAGFGVNWFGTKYVESHRTNQKFNMPPSFLAIGTVFGATARCIVYQFL